MSSVTMYSTGCPQCRVLEAKLAQKNIQYTKVTDIETMKSLNIMSVPQLEVNGIRMNFGEAVVWVRDYNG